MNLLRVLGRQGPPHLRGIDEQVRKPEQAAPGRTPVERNQVPTVTAGTKTVNRDLETKTRAMAGIKGYITNLRTGTV